MKVALVHYWLVGMRGGEKVLEQLCELYPDADIYTHVYDPDKVSDTIRLHKVYTTFISKLPFAKKLYQKYLPLMPLALESLDMTEYDLIISSEAGPAKGIIPRPDATHICYCHSPMRYIWDQYHVYKSQAGFLTRLMMPLISHYLRVWDHASAARVDHFIANSQFVAKRIEKAYRRKAEVIYPPVDVDAFSSVTPSEVGDFYLYVGELVSYKRPDLAVAACTQSGRKLVVIGDGAERKRLEKMAGPNITFLGKVSFDVLKDNYARCKALIFPGVEDFGIIPVEVMASRRPVIAFARGGVLETILESQTGLFFHIQSLNSLSQLLSQFEAIESDFDTQFIFTHSRKFSSAVFRKAITAFVRGVN